ncbi:hypothetical protein ILUMI_03308 [Ignelater luminosus]|uniref:C2H2-type domain-containing protein n=1 Tax=Ignelater luminosus TaxID=2038154 RepID=A0A8K0GFM3_IGNLU|nr:hypothetical protein ILUMI_03308 [Ignelater luminosus]
MSDSRIIVTDITSSTTEVDPRMLSSNIKEEVSRDDDILLFNTEMAVFSGDTSNFPIEELVTASESIGENTPFNIQEFDDGQINLLTAENFPKYSLDLSQICKLEPSKSDSQHFVKYKVQDGKHSKVWECGICAKEFGHQYTLMRHLPTHTDERKFQCNTCGKAFRQMSTLSQHRAIHSAERPYVCEICHKTFNRVSTLISHRKTHTGLKPHRCHLCNKAFHQKGNLRNHIFTHTNERPYKCDICAKGFNQMSNLMCHKVKAHQRADKPRYVCQICGKDFQKRIGLRNHEQYQHGVQNIASNTSSATPTRIKYTNGVLVDPINTAAMQHALATNQTPFALLRPLNGIPVLVRVLSAGDKQMLVPATAEDLKKHGQITITPQTEDQDKKEVGNEDILIGEQGEEACVDDGKQEAAKAKGSTVQIKIPVVATVVQRCGKDGNMCMAVQSPGPNTEGTVNENYTFTTTTDNREEGNSVINFPQTFESANFNNFTEENQIQSSTQIQFLDECGNLLNEDETKNTIFDENFQHFQQSNDVFTSDLQLEDKVFNIPETDQTILGGIDTNNVMNISYVNNVSPQILEMLEKPQVISLSETENVYGNVIYQDASIGGDFVMS